MVGQQERHPACKKYGGGGGGEHWLVRMEWRPARWSLCLPLLICLCAIKSRSSLLTPAHLGGPGKRAVNGCVCVCVCVIAECCRERALILKRFSSPRLAKTWFVDWICIPTHLFRWLCSWLIIVFTGSKCRCDVDHSLAYLRFTNSHM